MERSNFKSQKPSGRPMLLVAVISLSITPAFAASPIVVYPSFRVETDVYEGTQPAPQSQHLILFDAGVVYDLPVGQGTEMTVFDIPRGRVVLLDKATRVRTQISTDTLIQQTAQVRAAANEAGASSNLGIDAKVRLGEKPNTYLLEFGTTKYEATAQSVSDSTIAAEFASFTAWASRLNLVRHIGSPPFARMNLADYLANDNKLPRQVKLEVRPGLLKTRIYRSEHIVVERLSDLDRKKISDVGNMLASYEEVEFSEFPSN